MQKAEKATLYAAFKAKDARFDGRFFVGISSTGIYCRPICRARQPKEENCHFYKTAPEAEQAGYRPCLLCRPELAPGVSRMEASSNLAHRAARLLEESCGSGKSLENLAKTLGCTARHLRRVFEKEYHVSPIQYLQTCRLLLAKSLLTDTGLTVLDVAMAAGFGSLRRFNTLFSMRYRLSPTALRKQVKKSTGHDSGITLALSYRPPYRWEEMLAFLAGRAIIGVEKVENGAYMRTVRIKSGSEILRGWICVNRALPGETLTVTVSASLLAVLPQVLAKVKNLFDLYCDPVAIYEGLISMNEIRSNLCVLGTRLPGCFDAFEMAVRAVLGQQITVKAAGTLAARLVKNFGTAFETGIDGLTHAFPLPEEIIGLGGTIANHLGPLGIISKRAQTILKLAEVFSAKEIDFGLTAAPEDEIKKLLALPGIGEWTAHYIAMRAMGWTDAFLQTDAGVKKALAPHNEKEMLALAEKWRPWRSYAVVQLWNSL